MPSASERAEREGVRIYAHAGAGGGHFCIQVKDGEGWTTLHQARELATLYGIAAGAWGTEHPRGQDALRLLQRGEVVYEQPSAANLHRWVDSRFTHQRRAAATLGMGYRVFADRLSGARAVMWPLRASMALVETGEAIDAALAQLDAVTAGDTPAEMMARIMAARALLNGGG